MQIMNTFVAKIGPAGKRNRAARRRLARRMQGKSMCADVCESVEALIIPEPVDLTGPWDQAVAKQALKLFAESGMSQRAFAAEHSFPESRLRSWKKKFEVLTVN